MDPTSGERYPVWPVGCWVPQITASRYNAGEAFVVANDYRRGDFKAYIFRTTDYGKTWTRMVDENKVKGYALCMIQDPTEPNLIFVGTENGLWVSFDNGISYEQWKKCLSFRFLLMILPYRKEKPNLVICHFWPGVMDTG